jgi:5-methylcytosine-specific restriction endonuclease McrBC regulatory subunit McrC
MKKTKNIKKGKHDRIVKDYDKQKEKHLEKLATKMLKDEERNQKLKDKNINTDFLDLF